MFVSFQNESHYDFMWANCSIQQFSLWEADSTLNYKKYPCISEIRVCYRVNKSNVTIFCKSNYFT